MRKALQLAALVAGTVAAPNNLNAKRNALTPQNGQRGGGGSWQQYGPQAWAGQHGHPGAPSWVESASWPSEHGPPSRVQSASPSSSAVYSDTSAIPSAAASTSLSSAASSSAVSTTPSAASSQSLSSSASYSYASTTLSAAVSSSSATVSTSDVETSTVSSASSSSLSSFEVDAVATTATPSSYSGSQSSVPSGGYYTISTQTSVGSVTSTFSTSLETSAAALSGTPTTARASSGLVSFSFPEAIDSSTTTTVTTSPSSCALPPTAPLTNDEQTGSGGSVLGTLCAPNLPQWLDDYPVAPWGDLTTKNSDATVQGDIPVTNVTRSYEWSITRDRISADGVLRDVLLINDQFPGPIIEANWGDWIEVTVHNNISYPYEGTALHWHGQLQKTTPWEDGVPSVGQCPIAPGQSLTYLFQAQLHGTSWYHAHYSAQFAAGIAGPMIIHGPSSMPHDIDLGPVMLSDWYHIPYFSIVNDAVGTNLSLIPPTSDSNLINGRGRFNCSNPSYDSSDDWIASNIKSNLTWTCVDDAPLSSFRFQSGKTHRLRLINHGSNGVQRFSIDNHNMTVIATDYVPIVPYTADVITLGVGQRTDVLVTALDTPTAAIWMRSELTGGEPCGGSGNPQVLAAVYYEDADITAEPTSPYTASYNSTACWNDALTLTVPDYALTPSNNSWTQDVSLTLELNATGDFEFRVNNQTYRADFNVPLLQNVQEGNFTFEPQWNVYNFGPEQSNTSIILNVTNNMPLSHPFHLHGHNFYVLNFGEGTGPLTSTTAGANGGPAFGAGAAWDGTVVNPANPMRRDTIIIPPYGFAAVQFEMDNPGIWPFHCHVAWHLSGGQAINILYQPESIPAIPDGFVNGSCANWDAWTNTVIVDQIDAGA